MQSADGSWGENEYALNPSYVSAPKAFSAPFVYEGAPWREAINLKAMEAAYESLNDTSSQGCNNASLAAATLTAIKNAEAWVVNYGRDSVNRGHYYEVNSQSDDQDTVFNPAGTVSINVGSTSLTGTGTHWQTAGYCDGTHFVGIQTPRTVYKIASCCEQHRRHSFGGLRALWRDGERERQRILGGSIRLYRVQFAGDLLFRQRGGSQSDAHRLRIDGLAIPHHRHIDVQGLGRRMLLRDAWVGPHTGPTAAPSSGTTAPTCAGPACDGLITDVVAGAPDCNAGHAPRLHSRRLSAFQPGQEFRRSVRSPRDRQRTGVAPGRGGHGREPDIVGKLHASPGCRRRLRPGSH